MSTSDVDRLGSFYILPPFPHCSTPALLDPLLSLHDIVESSIEYLSRRVTTNDEIQD